MSLVLRNARVHCRMHMDSPLPLTTRQMNSVWTLTTCLFKIYFNIILSSMPLFAIALVLSILPTIVLCNYYFSYACRMSYPSRLPWFDHVNKIKCEGKKVTLSLCLINIPWRHVGDWTYSSILDLGTRWRWVVSFTNWPVYPGEEPPAPNG
jgi:hypothetical protein